VKAITWKRCIFQFVLNTACGFGLLILILNLFAFSALTSAFQIITRNKHFLQILELKTRDFT